MKRIISCVVVCFFCIVSLVGCSGKDSNNSKSSANRNNSKGQESQVLQASEFKSDISNYKVVDKRKPLKIRRLSDESFRDLISELDVHSRSGNGGMELSLINYLYSIMELRKVDVEDKTMYYCIFSDINDYERLYIFFWKLTEWSCYHYVVLPVNSLDKKAEQNNDIRQYINPLDIQ